MCYVFVNGMWKRRRTMRRREGERERERRRGKVFFGKEKKRVGERRVKRCVCGVSWFDVGLLARAAGRARTEQSRRKT